MHARTFPHRIDQRAPGGAGSHEARGFTLLEVLIAVSLLALLVMLAMGTLRTAVRAVHSGTALIERTDRTRVAQEFLRRQLSHAMPLPFERLEDTGENRVFVAERDALRFVAPMPGYLSRGGPHVQWLSLERDQDGMRLEFDHAQLNGYDPDDPKGRSTREPVVLLDGFSSGKFEYRALDEQGELSDWSSAWDDAQRLPLLVRLVIEFDPDSRRRWPDLEIPVLVATAVPGMFNRAGLVPGSDEAGFGMTPPLPTPPAERDP